MKLLTSPTSPFALKVLVVAHELGVADAIECVETHVSPFDRNKKILPLTPLAQVPALLLDDGRVLYDSRVICEYLDKTHGGQIFPSEASARWTALSEQSLGDGLMAAALVARYESVARPAEKRWSEWLDGHIDKISSVLAYIDKQALKLKGRRDIGTIALACAITYVDFRFPGLERRTRFSAASEWYEEFSQQLRIGKLKLG